MIVLKSFGKSLGQQLYSNKDNCTFHIRSCFTKYIKHFVASLLLLSQMYRLISRNVIYEYTNSYYSYRFEMATDIFLSYNWDKDESGRDNQHRVSLINTELKDLGYETWFDKERVWGSITEKTSQGIERSKGVIVFITRRYHEKVNGEDASDNCQLEFNYAAIRKTRKKMVAVVMDKCMCDTKIWTGQVGMHLGGEKYVDMTGDLKDRNYLSNRIKVLENELKLKEIVQLPGNLCSYFTFQCYCGEN